MNKLFLAIAILFLSFAKGAPAQTLVIVGVNGDLSRGKLLPAIEQLEKRGELPENFQLIGMGRKEQFQHQALSQYIPIAQIDRLKEIKGDIVYYLATPADTFAPTIDLLSEKGLIADHTRIVIEKPFGTDTASAETLQSEITHHLKEKQIYRIDHYLGKEVVQQIIPFRQSHPEIEKLLNREEVEKVTLTISEDIGIGSRGPFWEKTGMLRDVVQNHIMQVMTLIGMEMPASPAEKVRFLNAVRIEEMQKGQYIGYREEKGVDPNSHVETYVAAKLFVDNERWKGVPFHIEAGKKLKSRFAEVTITFKTQDPLIFRIQPNPQISWGEQHFLPEQTSTPEAYERLLLDALHGDPSHFVSQEELMASWNLWTPLLPYWDELTPQEY
ncbi:MAG TPA: glucose-6-phosphate dehydrogenase [Chlamydiales bacterium]|nr:glucose-6-phosphate dehydrogenase [Chlamydiales bacterium]